MNPEILNPYDCLPNDHELIQQYKPRFLARGGEHLVYLVDGHPNLVIKASSYKIKDSILNISKDGVNYDDPCLEAKARTQYSDEIKHKNDEIRSLKSFFGDVHMLKERRYLMKVPVTFTLLEEIFNKDYFKRPLPVEAARGIKEVWTHVVIQEFSEVPKDESRLSMTYGFFIEDSDIDFKKYQEVTDSIIGSNYPGFNREEFLGLQDHSKNKSLSKIIELAENDLSLRNLLKSFVSTTIQYAEKTGQILALAGEDNVLFYKDGEFWNFVLVDALPNSPDPIFKATKEIGQKISNNVILTSEEREYLKRGINFVRTINGIALILGLPDRLKLPDIFSKVDLLSIIKQ